MAVPSQLSSGNFADMAVSSQLSSGNFADMAVPSQLSSGKILLIWLCPVSFQVEILLIWLYPVSFQVENHCCPDYNTQAAKSYSSSAYFNSHGDCETNFEKTIDLFC